LIIENHRTREIIATIDGRIAIMIVVIARLSLRNPGLIIDNLLSFQELNSHFNSPMMRGDILSEIGSSQSVRFLLSQDYEV
jgi:hypothetical protein